MTGSTLTALAANPASSLETSTLSSTVSTAAASTTAASATVTSPARNTWIPNRLVKTVLTAKLPCCASLLAEFLISQLG